MLQAKRIIEPVGWDCLADRLTFASLAGAVSCVLLSIAASQILLAVAVAGTLWGSFAGKKGLAKLPSVFWPLTAFVAWTMVSISNSQNVPLGLTETKKFFLYLIPFLVIAVFRNSNARLIAAYRTIFLAAFVSALAGLIQFLLDPKLDLHHRITGFLGHWMTYSGVLMLVLIVLTAYAVCYQTRMRWWVAGLGVMLSAGMYLSQTRNSWIGSLTGIGIILLLKRRRALPVMAAALLALYLVSPSYMKQRLRSGWDFSNPETRSRIELLQTSLRLIKDHPWFGVGPKNVWHEALSYRGTHEFEDWLYQHMHNDFLQIAAERGIPGLLLWLWLLAQFARDAFRVYRTTVRAGPTHKDREATMMVSLAAVGALAAILVSGLFEYNFGDSEVLTLFLFIVSLPAVFL